MSAQRIKPEIGKKKPPSTPTNGNESGSYCWLPLFITASYFILSAIIRVDMKIGSKLDHLICYGALIGFTITMIWGAVIYSKESYSRMEDRKKWAENCITADLKIVDRRPAYSVYSDYSDTTFRSPSLLELTMNPDQKAVSQNQTTVTVDVEQYLYNRLKKHSSVRIYYHPESPMIFLLEDEL